MPHHAVVAPNHRSFPRALRIPSLVGAACAASVLAGCSAKSPAADSTAAPAMATATPDTPAAPADAATKDADLPSVARNLVQSAMVHAGDRVIITGSVRDAALMEDVAIETMKAGGQPLITLASEQLTRRSFDEVPAAYDTITPTHGLALVRDFDVQISVDVGETEGLLAGVPEARRAARAKAGEPVTQAFFARKARTVSLGNGIYPTATLAKRLGMPQGQLAAAFWKGAGVPADSLRARAEALRAALSGAKQLTLTHANGTSLTFGPDVAHALVSDGAITPQRAAMGSAAASTWLPAGELIIPAVPGTAEGKVVVDKMLWDGKDVTKLTLTYSKGKLTGMTADGDITGLKAAYDAAGGGKDQFAYIDLGLNPDTKLPVGTGRIVWTVPGAVTLGLGDNRGFGGKNASDFGLATQIGGATLKADGKTIIDNGVLP
jgi:leucyl aminopeptidase (aminopeptidase T)